MAGLQQLSGASDHFAGSQPSDVCGSSSVLRSSEAPNIARWNSASSCSSSSRSWGESHELLQELVQAKLRLAASCSALIGAFVPS